MTSGLDPNILQQIQTILRRDLKLPADAPLPDEMPFVGGDVDLDSLDMLLVLTSIERQFGLRIPSEEVGREVFQNVASLTRYVQENRGSPAAPPAAAAPPVDWLAQLPHRPPFRFISRVIEVRPGESAKAVWALRGDEAFFAGHFPGEPIVPGVLIAEALAQLSGLAAPAQGAAEGKLAAVDVRFEHPVAPPVEIELHSRLIGVLGALSSFQVIAQIGQTVLARHHRPASPECIRRQVMRTAVFTIMLALFCTILRAEAPTTLPAAAPQGIDAATWERMKQIDAKAAAIQTLSADFEQSKITPLLKKPMVSAGSVLAKGEVMRWDTRTPEPTLMRVDERQIEIFYPNQKTAEIYPLLSRLAELASSPVPRLATLLDHFSFSPASASDLGQKPDPGQLALRMTPTDKAVAEHVQSGLVLIDAEHGFILALTLTDPDGERTDLRFSNVKINPDLEDSRLKLQLPEGTRIVHPLEGAPRS